MGVCMIFVMLCHARLDGASYPSFILSFLDYLDTGVDVFLLVSGLGMYFSLSKAEDTGNYSYWKWIKRRLVRILIPYLFIETPFWLIYCVNKDLGFLDFLYYISMASFWVEHIGVWFLALIIPLYLVTPLIHKLLKQTQYNFILILLLIILSMVISVLPISTTSELLNSIIGNMQTVICRVPCYIIGLSWGRLISNKRSIHSFWLVLIPFLFFFLRFVPIVNTIYRGWLLAIAIAILLSYLIDCIKNGIVANKLLLIIGNATLSIYISYDVMKNVLHVPLGDGTWYYSLSIISGFVLGISYYYVELSARKWLKNPT